MPFVASTNFRSGQDLFGIFVMAVNRSEWFLCMYRISKVRICKTASPNTKSSPSPLPPRPRRASHFRTPTCTASFADVMSSSNSTRRRKRCAQIPYALVSRFMGFWCFYLYLTGHCRSWINPWCQQVALPLRHTRLSHYAFFPRIYCLSSWDLLSWRKRGLRCEAEDGSLNFQY